MVHDAVVEAIHPTRDSKQRRQDDWHEQVERSIACIVHASEAHHACSEQPKALSASAELHHNTCAAVTT